MRACRCLFGLLPHARVGGTFVMEYDKRRPHNIDRADGTVGIFVHEPVLILGLSFGGEIEEVANNRQWLWPRRDLPFVMLSSLAERQHSYEGHQCHAAK